eukprot:1340990-Pyramimonas_sp.AAC.1
MGGQGALGLATSVHAASFVAARFACCDRRGAGGVVGAPVSNGSLPIFPAPLRRLIVSPCRCR